ncbi:hypothetical protein HC928_11655 [bacterium]|nr:hypothetical protein [bacterium]
MRKKSPLFDLAGNPSGNSWTSAHIAEEEESLWDLAEQDEGCPECGYEGPLKSTRRGWKCPECREIIIPE